MKNSILLKLLSSFSVYEMNSFGKFVRSPFFNSNTKYIKLFEKLEPLHPEFDEAIISKEYVYSRMYPDTDYNDKQMRDHIYGLTKLAKEYLIYCGLKKDNFMPLEVLLNELGARKQEKLYYSTLAEAESMLKSEEFSKADYFLYRSFLNKKKYEYEFIETQKKPDTGIFSDELEALVNFFTVSLAYNSYDSNILARQYNLETGLSTAAVIADSIDFSRILAHLKQRSDTDPIIFELYYCLLILSSEKAGDETYFRAKELLMSNKRLFTSKDLYDIYSNLESYCIRKTRMGKLDFINEQSALYRSMINDKIFPIGNMYFPPELYKNIVRNAVRTGDFEMAEEFLNTNTVNVIPEMRDHLYYFCKALIRFAQKDFEDAGASLAQVHKSSLWDTEQVKSLEIRILYELGHFNSALEHIDSYLHYIKKNKNVSKFLRENYEPYIMFTKQLVYLRTDAQRNIKLRIEMLKDKVEQAVPLANKKWLLEKINELPKFVMMN